MATAIATDRQTDRHRHADTQTQMHIDIILALLIDIRGGDTALWERRLRARVGAVTQAIYIRPVFTTSKLLSFACS